MGHLQSWTPIARYSVKVALELLSLGDEKCPCRLLAFPMALAKNPEKRLWYGLLRRQLGRHQGAVEEVHLLGGSSRDRELRAGALACTVAVEKRKVNSLR